MKNGRNLKNNNMKLHVLASSSKGNCYLVYNETEALVIEAGIKLIEVKKALDFKISRIQGVLVTHEHGDHSKYVKEFLEFGLSVFMSKGTSEGMNLKSVEKPVLVKGGKQFVIGNFKILPFDVIHDAKEPLGYLINHSESGNILFLTDSHYSKYKFKNLNHIIVEANYDQAIVEQNIINGKVHPSMLQRLQKSHMSIDTCIQLLHDNDLKNVNNIVLIHLSGGNSNAREFRNKIIHATGINTVIAEKGLIMNMNFQTF
jgi:phosphoribosyl 1,2-cyclic phosphodiesterase